MTKVDLYIQKYCAPLQLMDMTDIMTAVDSIPQLENNQEEEARKQFRLAGQGSAGDFVRQRSGELIRQ